MHPILEGTKIHTLRLDPNDRWVQNRHIHLATGVRTNKYKCFKEETCKSVQRVVMSFNKPRRVFIWVGNRELKAKETLVFIKNDGFKNVADFVRWFWPNSDGYILELKLINWTNFYY